MEDRICLDTNFIVDTLRNQPTGLKIIKDLEEKNILATTYINLFELNYGAALSSNKRINFEEIDKLISRLELLNLAENSARIAGIILADLKSKGKLIEFRDVLVASMCISNDFQLLTENIKHFENIAGLKLHKL